MKFKYQAKTLESENQVGGVEAPNRQTAETILTGHNLFILSIEEANKISWYEKISDYFFNRLRSKELVIFTRQFAMLLEVRVPLGTSLKTMHAQTSNPILKEAGFTTSQEIN